VTRLITELVAAIVDLAGEGATDQRQHHVDALLSVDEVAEILGVGRTTVYGLLGSSELRSMRVRGRRLIPRSAVDDFCLRATSDPP
jgi:excisionase family DNA binding protein